MNKSELESILKKAQLPEIPEETLELFPRRIAARLKHGVQPGRAPRSFRPRWGWALGLAACIAIAIAFDYWSARTATGKIPAPDTLTSRKLIRETLAMFPNRVSAIVEDEHGMNLVLSEKPDVPVSTPIYVSISDNGRSSSMVTFSGQEVQIAGQKVTVLADAHGGVILAGQNFVWSESGRVYADGHLKIKAETLGPIAM